MNARLLPREKNPSLVPQTENPKYITSMEIAERTGINPSTFSTNMANNRYPIKVVLRSRLSNGGLVNLFDRREAEAWIASGAPDKHGHFRIVPTAGKE